MNLTEEELYSQLSDSRQRVSAFSVVVRTYQERLYWHVRKMVLAHDDANDILQNTFMKAWQALDSFRGDARLSTWLYRIATNETLTFLSSKQQELKSSNNYEEALSQVFSTDGFFDGDEVAIKLQNAILTLPDKQKLVFNMKYFDDLSYEEMERILGTSVGALKASYHHAVKKIEKIINEDL